MVKNLITNFKQAREKLIKEIKKFPKEKKGEILFGKWSLKDVVAHFAAWDIYFTNSLEFLTAGKSVPYWGNINDYNTEAVNLRKN